VKLTNIRELSLVTLHLKVYVEQEGPAYRVWCYPPGRIVSDAERESDLSVVGHDLSSARQMALSQALAHLALEVRRGTRQPDFAVYGKKEGGRDG